MQFLESVPDSRNTLRQCQSVTRARASRLQSRDVDPAVTYRACYPATGHGYSGWGHLTDWLDAIVLTIRPAFSSSARTSWPVDVSDDVDAGRMSRYPSC